MSELTIDISNSDIIWDADFVGLVPTVTGDDAKFTLENVENTISDLLLALSDPEKFVAAHVLLTKLTRIEYETHPTWNGLAVDIAADGEVTISSDQRYDLARRWQLWHRTMPRPKRLPLDH